MLESSPLKRRIHTPRVLFGLMALCGTLAIYGCGSSSSSSSQSAASSAAQSPSSSRLFKLLPASIRQSKVIRVASNAPFPPFEMFTGAGSTQFTGLDYDLGQAIGNVLGVKVTFTQSAFDGMIPALQAGKYDMIMAALTTTSEREKIVSFVDYAKTGTGILVAKGNPHDIKSINDLCGRTVATQSGASQVQYLASQQSACTAKGKPRITVLALPQFSDSQLAVTSGKAVAVVEDESSLLYAARTINQGNSFQVVSLPSNPAGYAASVTGVAMLKNNTTLINAVEKAVQQVIDNGTYKKLLAKYGLTTLAIPHATVSSSR